MKNRIKIETNSSWTQLNINEFLFFWTHSPRWGLKIRTPCTVVFLQPDWNPRRENISTTVGLAETQKIPGFDSWIRKIPWRRVWLPTAVFLPGKFYGQRSLASSSPWGRKESDTMEWHTFTSVTAWIVRNVWIGPQNCVQIVIRNSSLMQETPFLFAIREKNLLSSSDNLYHCLNSGHT